MMRWQNSLRTHSSADWVIIVVETNDTKKKNKTNILPRSSIVDKIRSDFCNKQNDRWGFFGKREQEWDNEAESHQSCE